MDWRDIWKDITDSVLEGIWGMNKKDPRALLALWHGAVPYTKKAYLFKC